MPDYSCVTLLRGNSRSNVKASGGKPGHGKYVSNEREQSSSVEGLDAR
jgi:hypothetical protein